MKTLYERCYCPIRLHDFAHSKFGRQLQERPLRHLVDVSQSLAATISEEWLVVFLLKCIDERSSIHLQDCALRCVGDSRSASERADEEGSGALSSLE